MRAFLWTTCRRCLLANAAVEHWKLYFAAAVAVAVVVVDVVENLTALN